MTDGIALFLDSGAYSAYTQGKPIDVYAYIDFIKSHLDDIDVYASLDVIGSAEGTWKNQEIMEAAGLRPMPVYHAKEPVEYLHRCLDNYEYFALGDIAQAHHGSTRWSFFDRCFDIICATPDRTPRRKVHGFGVFGARHLWRYPWYSVDSTSWKIQAANGKVYVPYRDASGAFVYDQRYELVTLSSRATAEAQSFFRAAGVERVKTQIIHIENMSPQPAERTRDYFAQQGWPYGRSSFKEVGADYKLDADEKWMVRGKVVEVIHEAGISTVQTQREAANIHFFNEAVKTIPAWPWPFVTADEFIAKMPGRNGRPRGSFGVKM
jgi:hypothetical protein